MDEVRQLLEQTINETFMHMTISAPKRKGGVVRIRIRPVLLKGKCCYQEERFDGTQVHHRNLSGEDRDGLIEDIIAYMQDFRQLAWETAQEQITVLAGKKQARIQRRKKDCVQPGSMEQFAYEHNRRKRYILQEGQPVDFLVELGVMTKEGRIVHSKYDKFRQINRFLEFIEDVEKELPSDREITIIDFGCGKSYLTFAMYYYLNIMKKYPVRIIGLDLKEAVIRKCNELAVRFGYKGLKFLHGDIAEYEGVTHADMVVTLHACDTATDYALAKAVRWNASVILSVPCCQHEMNRQIDSRLLEPVLGYGLIRERVAALFTDAMRARLLEQQGYQVQVMEFIDMEHTPKNILIRAVRHGGKKAGSIEEAKQYEECRDFLHVQPMLEKLLKQCD